MVEAVRRVEECILSGETHQIATANLDFARNALRDAHLQQVICECSMVLPDGAPMVWASRLFGQPLQERVTGVDLIPELAHLSAARGYGLFLLGSNDATCARAMSILIEQHPGVRFVGHYCPEVQSLEDMDDEEMLGRIEAANPDVLLVAFGNPKQEIWIHKHRGRLKVPVSIGVGGALSMIAGSVKRAPKWVQRAQMEWFFRMAQEPGRLLPRYVKDAAALVRHLPMGLAVSRMQPGHRVNGKLRIGVQGSVRVVGTPEMLSGDLCSALTAEAHAATAMKQMLVVDMTETARIEADGLGCLLEARRVMRAAGLSIWLAGMSNPVRRVLQFSAMSDLFRLAGTPAEAIRFASMGQNDAEWKAEVIEMRPKDRVAVVTGAKVAKA